MRTRLLLITALLLVAAGIYMFRTRNQAVQQPHRLANHYQIEATNKLDQIRNHKYFLKRDLEIVGQWEENDVVHLEIKVNTWQCNLNEFSTWVHLIDKDVVIHFISEEAFNLSQFSDELEVYLKRQTSQPLKVTIRNEAVVVVVFDATMQKHIASLVQQFQHLPVTITVEIDSNS